MRKGSSQGTSCSSRQRTNSLTQVRISDEAGLCRNLRHRYFPPFAPCISSLKLISKDLHEYVSGPILIPNKPHPITGSKYPVTIGHEFAGIVEEVGPGVSHLSPGQKAVVRPTIFDNCCRTCMMGYEYCCENIGFIGLSGMCRVFCRGMIKGANVLIAHRLWRWNGEARRGSSRTFL